MSSLITQYTSKFKSTPATFTVTVSDGRIPQRVELTPTSQHFPETVSDDIIDKLACDHFTENFSAKLGKWIVSEDSIVSRVMHEIMVDVRAFYYNYSTHKKPKLSKTGRWLSNVSPTDNSICDGMIHVYRFINSFRDDRVQGINSVAVQAKVDAAIKIIELMKEHHEKLRR